MRIFFLIECLRIIRHYFRRKRALLKNNEKKRKRKEKAVVKLILISKGFRVLKFDIKLNLAESGGLTLKLNNN